MVSTVQSNPGHNYVFGTQDVYSAFVKAIGNAVFLVHSDMAADTCPVNTIIDVPEHAADVLSFWNVHILNITYVPVCHGIVLDAITCG
eukprot:189187-Chlamydomonas_euryale.AAC.1